MKSLSFFSILFIFSYTVNSMHSVQCTLFINHEAYYETLKLNMLQ